jgi:hypothetical protein
MNAGYDLRLAREKRGWSREDLSARTKISVPMLEAIEEVAIDRLPAAIYLRGFLRLFAVEVGLPAAGVVERYLAYCDSASRELTAFDSEATVLETPIVARPPAAIAIDDFQPETAPPPSPAAASPAATRRAIRRIMALAASLVFLVASMVAVRWLGPATQPVALSAMPAALPTASGAEPLVSRSIAPPDALRASVMADTPATRVATSRAEPVAMPPDSASEAAELSGAWMLTNEVQSTSYKAFEGLQLGYRLTLAQDGAIVTGRGEKWTENGREVPSSRRTPISVAGTLHQGRLDLSFTERGTRRSSAGRFVWQVADDGALRGTFVSDAASSRGSSYARRTQ